MVYLNKKRVTSNMIMNIDKDKLSLFTENGFEYPVKQDMRLWLFYKP